MLRRLLLRVWRAKPLLVFPLIALSLLACSLTASEPPTPTIPPEEATVTVGAIVNRGSPPTRTPIGASAQLPQGEPPTPIEAINEDVQTEGITDPTRQARVSANLSNPDCPMPQGWTTYTVNAGDSLYRISQNTDSSVDELAEVNCIVDPRYIEVGQVIAVPGDGSETITTANTVETAPTADTSGRILEAPGTVDIYLVLEVPDEREGGIEVGCGNMLVPVSRTVFGADTAENRVKAALESLLAIDSRTVDEYTNPLSASSLAVEDVSITQGVARVTLSGEFSIAGACQIPLLRGQIEQTILADTAVDSTVVTVNGKSLDEVFSQR